MHHRMQQLIKARHKDDVINVRSRASLYQTIDRLERDGVGRGSRHEPPRRPARADGLCVDGRGTRDLRALAAGVLASPAREFPEFPVAIAHLPLLAPVDALRQLEQRAEALVTDVNQIEEGIALAEAAALPRLFLLELEYALAARQAELAWVRSLVDDLRTGRLTWSAEWLEPYRGQPKPSLVAPEGGSSMT